MPKRRVRDIEMFWVEEGTGEPLVLVMGFGGDHLAWAFQMQAFSERHRVLAFDNRGAGQSAQPDHPYTIRMMADDTVALMDAVGIGRAHVLGVSMGGMIAQEIALAHPDRVATLQLHCTLARPDAYVRALIDAWREVRTTLPQAAALRTIFPWLFAPSTYNERPEFVEALLGNALANPYPQTTTGFIRQGDAIKNHDTLERLHGVRCPTLVSVAEHDILVPPRFSRALAQRIPDGRLQIIDGAGHVYFWERPEAFNTLCLDFLKQHPLG
jgi:pimeloyl-ACP methyl ester carboxylesterase